MNKCIFSTTSEYNAELVCNELRENNIVFFAKNLHSQNLFTDTKLYTNIDAVAGNIEIFVEEDDYKKCEEIINKLIIIEPKEDEKTITDKNIFLKSFILSCLSMALFPIYYNIEYIYYLYKNKIRLRHIILIFNAIGLLFSIGLILSSASYLNFIFMINIFIVTPFSIFKFISVIVNNKPKKKLLLLIPPIITIICYILNEVYYFI
jgi:hypothetical protein